MSGWPPNEITSTFPFVQNEMLQLTHESFVGVTGWLKHRDLGGSRKVQQFSAFLSVGG